MSKGGPLGYLKIKSAWIFLGACFLFAFITLMATKAMFMPSDPTAKCTAMLCLAYRVLSEFQTLFAAGVALIAAMPVWRQIQKMNVQQDIMAREIIERRLDSIETKARYVDLNTRKLVQGIWRTAYDLADDENEYDPSSITPEWAFNIRKHAEQIASELERHQIAKADTLRIEAARAKVIAALGDLADCAASISAPAEWDGDPLVSDEDMQRMKDALPEALEKFPRYADAVEAAAKDFAAVAAAESSSVRDRLRTIAEQLIRDHQD